MRKNISRPQGESISSTGKFLRQPRKQLQMLRQQRLQQNRTFMQVQIPEHSFLRQDSRCVRLYRHTMIRSVQHNAMMRIRWAAMVANSFHSKSAKTSPTSVSQSTLMEVPVVEVTSPFQITTSCPEAGTTSLGGVAAVEAVVVLKTSRTWYKRIKKSEQGKV